MSRRKPHTERPGDYHHRAESGHAMVLVPYEELGEIMSRLDRLFCLFDSVIGKGDQDYKEPGPNSKRKYFTPAELAERWSWGMTKIYEIPASELPYFKRGQLKRYHWRDVWVFEGRISQEEADAISTPELSVLENQAEAARLRNASTVLDEGDIETRRPSDGRSPSKDRRGRARKPRLV